MTQIIGGMTIDQVLAEAPFKIGDMVQHRLAAVAPVIPAPFLVIAIQIEVHQCGMRRSYRTLGTGCEKTNIVPDTFMELELVPYTPPKPRNDLPWKELCGVYQVLATFERTGDAVSKFRDKLNNMSWTKESDDAEGETPKV